MFDDSIIIFRKCVRIKWKLCWFLLFSIDYDIVIFFVDYRMFRKKSWKKVVVKKNICKVDVGDKYFIDVGYV